MARKKKEDYKVHTGHSGLYDQWAKERRTHQVKSSRYRSTIIGTVMVCAVIVLALWGGSAIIRKYLSGDQQATPLPSLTPTPAPTVIPSPSPTPPTKISQPFKDAMTQNEDVVGWIKIEGTVINYPVVQGEDNDFYMTRGYDRKVNDAGAIFMDVRCNAEDAEEMRHYVLYGKNMEDGSRFSELDSYLQESFFNQHKIITLDLLSGNYEFEVFSAYIVPEEYEYTQVKWNREPLWLSFIQDSQSMSAVESDIQLNSKDVVLTLSTYLNPLEKAKVAVHARLVK